MFEVETYDEDLSLKLNEIGNWSIIRQQGLKLDYKLGLYEVWVTQNIIGYEF